MPRKVETSWLGAITRAQHAVRKGRISVPVLVMHSDKSAYGDTWTPEFQKADGVLNVEHMHKSAPKLGHDVTECVVPDALHDIFLSRRDVRDNAYDNLFDWLYARNMKAKP